MKLVDLKYIHLKSDAFLITNKFFLESELKL